MLIKEGKWYAGWKNICLSIVNALCFLIGMMILACGTYVAANLHNLLSLC